MDCPLCKNTCMGKLLISYHAEVLLEKPAARCDMTASDITLVRHIVLGKVSEIVCNACGASSRTDPVLGKLQVHFAK